MPRRSSFLAVGAVFLLAAAVLAAGPIYDEKPGHPWDQAREIFYTHRFPTGELFEIDLAVSELVRAARGGARQHQDLSACIPGKLLAPIGNAFVEGLHGGKVEVEPALDLIQLIDRRCAEAILHRAELIAELVHHSSPNCAACSHQKICRTSES